MLRQIQKGILNKKLVVQKGPAIQGSVCIHFQNPEVKDIILHDQQSVDVYQRINVTDQDIPKSNLEDLLLRGYIVAME
jgi:hypothetical protein